MCCRPKAGCRRAFTLVELMVVIVIIGLLASTVTMGVRKYLITGKQNIAKLEIANICQALDSYYAMQDRYPTNEESLTVLVESNGEMGGNLLTKIPRDPWGNPYEYNHPGHQGPYEVVCLGADYREGGDGPNEDLSSDSLQRDSR